MIENNTGNAIQWAATPEEQQRMCQGTLAAKGLSYPDVPQWAQEFLAKQEAQLNLVANLPQLKPATEWVVAAIADEIRRLGDTQEAHFSEVMARLDRIEESVNRIRGSVVPSPEQLARFHEMGY